MGYVPLPPPRAPLSLFEKGARWCRAYLFVLPTKALAYLLNIGLFRLEICYVLIIFVCLFVLIGFFFFFAN
jgi:hypothetical protein